MNDKNNLSFTINAPLLMRTDLHRNFDALHRKSGAANEQKYKYFCRLL